MSLRFIFVLFICSPAALAQQNLFTQENGVTITGFSSSYGGGWAVENLVPELAEMKENNRPVSSYVWCSADNQFPHWVSFQLKQPTWITTFVLNNAIGDEDGYPGISARDVELWIKPNGSSELKKWTALQLQRNKNGQEVKVEPVEAIEIKLIITSNWGNPTWTEFNAMGVFDDGTRPLNVASELKARKEVNLYGIYFDFGSAVVKAESQAAIRQLADFLSQNPEASLRIEGHTDNVGQEAANQKLSEQRAQAVVEQLVNMNIVRQRLTFAGWGSQKPIADNATETGRSQNRRVSVVLLP